MTHVPRLKRNIKTGRVTWQLSMEVETQVAQFNHISCPPLRLRWVYAGEEYEPWKVHLPIRWRSLCLWHEKHPYILGSWELITVDTRIYTLWTHICFDETYAISHLRFTATDSHSEVLIRCTSLWHVSVFHILFFLKTAGVVQRRGIM